MRIKSVTSTEAPFEVQFPADKEFDVVGLGQNAVDHYIFLPRFPTHGSKYEIAGRRRLSGGQIATAVSFTSRLGLRSKYIGKVGSDQDGKYCLECLRSEALDISSVIVAPDSRNHCSLILLDRRDGERTILWERDPGLNFGNSELKRGDVCAGRVLLLDESDPEASLLAVRWAREEGIAIVADLDHATSCSGELVPLVDFLIVSEDFTSEFTGKTDRVEALLAMRDSFDGFLAATLGSEGAIAAVGDHFVTFPGHKVEVMDTTGAGDVFHGAFIFGLLQNWPLKQIMEFANVAAGLACTRLGAREGLPTLAEIHEKLHRI